MENNSQLKVYNSTETRELIGKISTTTLWRYVKMGLIHKPMKPTAKQNLWKAEWIEEFIANMEMAS